MPCEVDADEGVEADILSCESKALDQIRTFLYELQEDPRPNGREYLRAPASFYFQLPCGYFVSWEIQGDVLRLALTGNMSGIALRILGVGRERPKHR
jgi:hypothetical protein